MGVTDALGLDLIPSDDEGLSAADELAAAVAGAVAEPGAIIPQPEEAPTPFGLTWAFDWSRGQFIRAGGSASGSPSPITGFAAVQEYVQMILHTSRYAHSVFSDEFGMEQSEEPIGKLAGAEIISEYEQHLREAVLVHDRITALDKFSARFDNAEGVLVIAYFEVVTDEEDVISFSNITVAEAD